MECSLATTLGMSSNVAFNAMCVDLEDDGKPVVYINQPQAYFNLFGDTYIENLIFSGIN